MHDGLGLRLGGHDAGLLLALGLQDGGLLGGIRLENQGLLLALRHQDLGLLLPLRLEDGLPALPLRLHLLLHGVLDLLGRDNVFQLHPVDFDAPGVRGLVQNGAHLGVDGVPACQGLVQFHLADDVPQGGGGQVLNGV
ncbi:peptide deformylase, partial [Dysosmobacter welbionis]